MRVRTERVNTAQVDGVVVVTLDGRLDVTGSQVAHDALVAALPAGGRLVIDMTACDYVASSGLRVLLIVAKQSAASGCTTVLCGVQEHVRDVIEMTGFENLLAIHPDQDAALAALG